MKLFTPADLFTENNVFDATEDFRLLVGDNQVTRLNKEPTLVEPGLTSETLDLHSKIHCGEVEGKELKATEIFRIGLGELEEGMTPESDPALWLIAAEASANLAQYTLHAVNNHRTQKLPVLKFPSGAMCVLDEQVISEIITTSESPVCCIYADIDEFGMTMTFELEDGSFYSAGITHSSDVNEAFIIAKSIANTVSLTLKYEGKFKQFVQLGTIEVQFGIVIPEEKMLLVESIEKSDDWVKINDGMFAWLCEEEIEAIVIIGGDSPNGHNPIMLRVDAGLCVDEYVHDIRQHIFNLPK